MLRAPLGFTRNWLERTYISWRRKRSGDQNRSGFGVDSLTSVSARTGATGTAALNIPYGTTTDLIEYFFAPGTSNVLSTMPVGELRLAGAEIDIASDNGSEIRVDARGGGDLFAYEFIPGTGGSRDVLDRFNADSFSSNAGLQFADGRQVYAILPVNSAAAALFDPVYSADYSGGGGIDLYGRDAGLSVTLDAAPGIAAGGLDQFERGRGMIAVGQALDLIGVEHRVGLQHPAGLVGLFSPVSGASTSLV